MNASGAGSHSNSPLRGAAWMMFANLHFGLISVFVRMASARGIPSTEISFMRFAVACVIIAALVLLGLGDIRPNNLRLLIWRGVISAGAVMTYFFAIQMTSAGKGTLLNYTHSIWANVFLVLFFGHKPPRGFWLLLLMAATGLWLVSNPHFDTINRGDVLGIISGMLGGGAILTIKNLRRTDNALTIFTSFAVISLVCSAVPGVLGVLPGMESFPRWVLPDARAWAALLGVGVASMIGQVVFTHAYAFTSIQLGTILSLSVPALAALGGWYFLGEPLEPHFLLGGTLIMGACAALGIQEARSASGEIEEGRLTPEETKEYK